MIICINDQIPAFIKKLKVWHRSESLLCLSSSSVIIYISLLCSARAAPGCRYRASVYKEEVGVAGPHSSSSS